MKLPKNIRLRCSKCKKVYTGRADSYCPKCKKICDFEGIADASKAHSLNEISDAFAEIEALDIRVSEVIVLADEITLPFDNPRSRKLKIIGKGGMTKKRLWGAKVRIHSDQVLLGWNEKQL